MIIFEKIRWMNMLSTGNIFTEIDLDSHKSTLIMGKNGSGKSTVLDCLCFVLFNKPFRNINKSQLLNSVTGKNGLVEIDFSIQGTKYKIRRGIKPNIFEIYRDSVLLNQSADSRDYQDILEKNILKMGYKTFCQIVILGSANYTPFMLLKAAERRAFIEDLLDIQIFSVMNVLLKDKISNHKTDTLENDLDIKSIQNSITLIEKHEEELRRNTTDLINQKQEEIRTKGLEAEDIQTDIEKLVEEIKADEIELERSRVFVSKLEDANRIQNKLDSKIKKYEKEIQFYRDSTECPTCQQEITEDFRVSRISNAEMAKKTKISDNDKLSLAITQLKKEVQKYQNMVTIISTKNKNLQNLNAKLYALQSYIQSMQKDIITLQKNTENKITQDKQLYIDKMSHAILKKERLQKDKELYTLASLLLKDGGIKTKIIKQYVPVINKCINKYLTEMDFFCQFHINEEFEEQIKSMHRDDFSFESFSEGEKMRLNLAILFTWRDLARMRNSTTTNLLLLDEVMDSSLDSQGTEDFIKIINQLSGKNNIFIISHKTDQIVDKFEKVVHFDKIKNFSRVI